MNLRLVIAFCTCLTSVSAASPTAAVGDWSIGDHIPLNRIVIQAHRGAGFLAEENTLAAFELGWSLGCYAEADIRITTDGVIVAFHDNNFDRVVKNLPTDLKRKGQPLAHARSDT